MASLGYKRLYNYKDDLIYIGHPKINQAYAALLNILAELGLGISQKKLVESTTSVICLG